MILNVFIEQYNNKNNFTKNKSINTNLFKKFLYITSLNTDFRMTKKASEMSYLLSNNILQNYLDNHFD